jgi:hypothetical protein
MREEGETVITGQWACSCGYSGIIISASLEHNLAFLAAPGVSVHICPLTELISKGAEAHFTDIASSELQGQRVCIGEVGDLLLFAAPDCRPLVALTLRPRPEVSQLAEGVCAWLSTSAGLFAIDKDGIIYNLTPSGQIGNNGPAPFWGTAEVATPEEVAITGIGAFRRDVDPKLVKLSVLKPDIAIVGLQIAFELGRGDRPSAVHVNGARIQYCGDRHLVIPLTPDKVNVELELEGRCDIVVASCIAFVVPADQIGRETVEWMEGDSLLDFEDSLEKPAGARDAAIAHVAMAVSPDADEEIEEDLIKDLVRVIYRRPEWTLFARSAIVRIARVQPAVITVWGKILGEMIEDKEVNQELWDYVSRDFCRFPVELKRELQDVMWETEPAKWSLDGALAAFAGEDPI